MHHKNIWLNPETLEDVENFIKRSISLGSTARQIAEAIACQEKGMLLLTKELGVTATTMSREEVIVEFIDYINEVFADHLESGEVSEEMMELLRDRYGLSSLDDLADTITEVISSDPFRNVHQSVTRIILSHDVHMKQNEPEKYKAMSLQEREVALIDAIKSRLSPQSNTENGSTPI